MDRTILPVALLLNAVALTDGQQFSMNPIPRLLLDTITYYDMFGDDVGMAYYNGYVQVECEIGPSLYVCAFDKIHLIDPDGDVVWSAECKDRVTLRLDINEDTKFGEYKCQYKNESSSEVLPYEYRFCAPEASKAELDACKGEYRDISRKHCVVTSNGTDGSREIEKAWCLSNKTGITYCTKFRLTGESSLCKSMSRHSYAEVLSRVNDDFCFSDQNRGEQEAGINWIFKHDELTSTASWTPVPYNSRILVYTKLRPPDPYDKYAKVVPDKYVYTTVEVHCPGCQFCDEKKFMTATCIIAKKNGEIIEQRIFGECNTYPTPQYIFNHSIFEDDQFDIYKFKCAFDNGTAVVARTQHYLVDFGITSASIQKTNKSTGNSDDDQYTKLECRLTSYPPYPWEIDEWRWFHNRSGTGKDEMSKIYGANTSIVSVRYPAKFWCQADIRYEPCSLDSLLQYSIARVTSENVTAVPRSGAPSKPLHVAEFLVLNALFLATLPELKISSFW